MADTEKADYPRAWTMLVVSCVVFVSAWIVGLVIGGPAATTTSSGAVILDAHRAAGIIQPLLVHGVAGVGIAAIATALARILRPMRVLAVLGIAAAVLSFAQLACELVLAFDTSVTDDAARSWWTALTMLDGIKMLVLAALMVLTALRGRRLALSRRLLPIIGYAAAVAITVSGIGYLLLTTMLMDAANLSLPLLLVWALILPLAVRSARVSP